MQKFNLLSISIITSIFLIGCGGGSGGGNNTSTDNTNSSQKSSLSGVAIDGYLEKALVCLDKNNNSNCDIDEPQTLTDINGNYSLTNISEEDKLKYPLLLKAIAGQTKDSDDNGVTISNSFLLKAPIGLTNITPFTTLIQNQIEQDPTLDINSATTIIKDSLSVPSNIDISSDYVAKKSLLSTDAEEYSKLHKIAQVITGSMASSLKDSNIPIDGADIEKAQLYFNTNISNKLADIKTAVSKNDFSKETYVSSLKVDINNQALLEAENIKELNSKTEKVTNNNLLKNLYENEGLFYFITPNKNMLNIYKDYIIGNNLEKDIISYSYNDIEKKLLENKYSQSGKYSKTFIDYYIPSETGWKKITRDSEQKSGVEYSNNNEVSFNNDGSITVKDFYNDYKISLLTQSNLENISIKNIISSRNNISLTEEKFKENSIKYNIKYEYINKYPIKFFGEHCFTNDENITEKDKMTCMDMGYKKGDDFSTFSDFINHYKKGTNNYFTISGYYVQFEEEKVYYFDFTKKESKIIKSLKKETINGLEYYHFVNSDSTLAEYEIFTIIDGKLRNGYLVPLSQTFKEEYFNKNAIDEIKNAIEMEITKSKL